MSTSFADVIHTINRKGKRQTRTNPFENIGKPSFFYNGSRLKIHKLFDKYETQYKYIV